jgi:hypothetical protein
MDAPDPQEIAARLEVFAALGGTLTGDEVLGQVHAALTRYIMFPSAEAADAVTLYVAATHAQPSWQHATRLVVKSAEKRCGKTRLLEVARELVHRPVPTVNISPAALVRSIDEDDPPTLVCDEADRIFGGTRGASESTEIITGILNAGFARGWPYTRWDVTTRAPQECPTFAMAVMASKGADLPDTIEDRAVIVTMRRKLPGDGVAKFRAARAIPALRALRDRLSEWVLPHRDGLGKAAPVMPPGLDDRAEDLWEPLLAVADAAGGDWSRRARRAAQVLAAERADADTDSSYGVRLLADISDLYGGMHLSFIPSRELLGRLVQLDEAPWRDMELTTRGLADRLRAFGIRPGYNPAKTTRGYHLEEFADAFSRYLSPDSGFPPSESTEPSETMPDLREWRGSSETESTVNYRNGNSPMQSTVKVPRSLPSSEAVSDGSVLSDVPHRTCEVCGGSLNGKRPHARTCSGRCRQAASRARRGG